jgi:predicted RNA-binding Zn-ribbon protein involved in translation (DUF1610 family)
MTPFRRRPDSPEIKRRGRGPGNLVVATCARCGSEFPARSSKARTCPDCQQIVAREQQSMRNGPVRSLVDAKGFVPGLTVRVPSTRAAVLDGRTVMLQETTPGDVVEVRDQSVLVQLLGGERRDVDIETLRRANASNVSLGWHKWVAYD